MSEARVLVTGAQGFIGRYLVAHWLSSDQRARVLGIGRSESLDSGFTHRLDWNGTSVMAPLPGGLRFALKSPRYDYESASLLDRGRLESVIRAFRPTVVVHLAGSLRGEATDRLIRGNIVATENLLESLSVLARPAPRLLLVSSGSVYGPGAQQPVCESAVPCPVDAYATTKLASEHLAQVMARAFDIPTVVARVFNVLGPGQDERHLAGWLASQFVAIELGLRPPTVSLGPLDTTRDFIDVRELALALKAVADNGEPGCTYNVASGRETHVQEIFDGLVNLSPSGSRIEIRRKPRRRDEMPRSVAEVSRLTRLGFVARLSIPDSLRDILSYYRRSVAGAGTEWASRRTISSSVTANGEQRSRTLRVCGQIPFGYPVKVEPDLLAELPARLSEQFDTKRLAILTDRRVWDLYGSDLSMALRAEGNSVSRIVIDEGEAAKSFPSYLDCIRQLYEAGFDRRSLLINLGGGIVTDVGGFVSASYLRGVGYINVPTTLLAQADAAIGGKVAVNVSWAKNYVGAFHHPEAVFSDPVVLKTLDDRQVAAGFAEIIKVAIISDPELLALLESGHSHVFQSREATFLADVVAAASRIKISLLEPDPYERDLRRVLNFGHSIGHAVETSLGYETILHGEAVAFGMLVAAFVAFEKGILPETDLDRIIRLLQAYRLPPPIDVGDARRALHHLDAIRLVRGRSLNFVLPTGIGSVEILDEIDDQVLVAAVENASRVSCEQHSGASQWPSSA